MKELSKRSGAMRAEVDARAFSDALKKAGEGLTKSAIPALSEVCVRFFNGTCTVTGTSLDTWSVVELPSGGDDFAFVFSRTRDVERACRCFDGRLTLELTQDDTSGGLVTLTCGRRAGEFETYPAEDYPAAPGLTGDVSFSTNAAVLLERISRVAYAAKRPDQSSREITFCVQFSHNNIFAIDGRRAAWDTDRSLTFPRPFMVCAEHLRLLKLFGGAQVEIRISSPHLYVMGGNLTVILRMAQAVPFDLSSAIPRRYIEEFTVNPQTVLKELTYLSNATPKTRTPCVCLSGNELFLSVNGKKYSTAIDAGRQSRETLTFELGHLMDAFRQFGKEPQVKVKISGPNTPVVVEAEGRGDCALVLPTRLKEHAAA